MILITGGAGFIGRELVKQLLEENNRVLILDDFSYGKQENIFEFQSNSNFFCEIVDITNSESLKYIFAKYKDIQTLIHLAAVHFIPFCEKNPTKTFYINFASLPFLVDIANSNGVKNFLFASSGAIYPPINSLINESQLPDPVDNYGFSKYFGEEYINKIHKKFPQIHFINMRFFNVYGPYETNPHLIPDIMEQLKINDSEIRLGNIETKRDYIFVSDMASAISSLVKLKSNSVIKPITVNIGTGFDYSAKDLVSIISDILGKKIHIDIDRSRLRKADKLFQSADVSLIESLTGWKPKYDIKSGLIELMKFEKLIKK